MAGLSTAAAPLSRVEQQSLANYEQTIERGLKTFYDVGNALLQIRNWRLYRATYPTFEDYCQGKWGMKQSRAYQLMDAAGIVDSLKSSTMVELPQNERQARALMSVEPELRPVVMHTAAAIAPNGNYTTAHIEQAKREIAPLPARVEAQPAEPATSHPNPLFMNNSEEWYTPQHIIDRVVDFFDVIDLDPCSNSLTEPNVPAEQHYTKEQNGLRQAWTGRVYMNPPYGSGIIDPWITKVIAEYKARHIEAAIALIPSRTDTAWFWPVWPYPLCFIRGRLKFRSPEGTDNAAPFGSVVAYLGTDIDGFRQWFGDLGHIVRGSAHDAL